jgi:LRR receptor-like serine/threonine-protein kinase FLS2
MIIETPSLLFLIGFLLVQSCMLQSYSQSFSNSTDQLALLTFKSNITSSPNQTLLAANWTTTTNLCNWVGVSCSQRRQRVTALNLSNMGLEGTISPHIGNLSFLVSLDLSNNGFFSFLPHEISRLHRLRILQLSSNLLEGNIPPTLHYCRKLQGIDPGLAPWVGDLGLCLRPPNDKAPKKHFIRPHKNFNKAQNNLIRQKKKK